MKVELDCRAFFQNVACATGHPLNNGDFSNVIMGILAILVGVAGGILIFKGSTQEKSSPKLILIGLSLAVISLCLIFALGNFVPEWQIPSISS